MTQTLPVPFYILCGSLGAGKTTLLMRLLEYWNSQGHKVGVLMNEAGEVSIDGPRAGTIAEQVLNLAGGCICCDTKDDLAWSITQLVQDYQSTLIVLECSGMADPAEVVDAVTDAYVSRIAKLERILAMLHPVPLPDTGMAEIVTRNAIRYADDLILNKRDLYIPGHWEQFRDTITRVQSVWTDMGNQPRPAGYFFSARRTRDANASHQRGLRKTSYSGRHARISRSSPPHGDHGAAAEAARPHQVHGMDKVITGGHRTGEGIFSLCSRNRSCRSFSSFPHAPAPSPR